MSNGYGRSATVVVAACNASAASMAAADYVCTGTNDNATIQDAIRTLTPAAGGCGGRVILTEGTYQRANPVYIDSDRITLEGQGDATQFSVASGGFGSAHIIIGSNGAYDGVVYTGGDTAPTAPPQDINLRNMLFSDYSSIGVALTGSSSGLICRGSNVHTSDVNVQTVQLDGLRWEGFRQMGGKGTLSAAVATTPAWGTTETWTVSMASPPTTLPFTCIVTPAGGGDYDPEIINVTNVSGTKWSVQRAWMQTAAKIHAAGASIAVLNVTTTFNNVTSNCFLFSPLRTGLFTQQGLDDSEWVACQIDGGVTAGQEYTENGIWAGGSNCRWIACHPYFCSQNGFYGNVQTTGNPVHVIIGGEYENCGGAGIAIQQSSHVTIEGGVSMYGNVNDIIMSYVTDFRIHDIWMNSAANRHIQLNFCNQGTVHDNVMSGVNSGYMIQVLGSGPNANAEIDIHDNIFVASGSSYATALNLIDVAGVRVHDNVLEEGLLENGTSDYNVITGNTMVSPVNGITVAGGHTRSYDNPGVSDYASAGSSAPLAARSDHLYWLNGASSTVTLQPPGYGAGSTALAPGSVGVALPAASITLAAAPYAWPASGTALIPVSGGHAVVNYQYISGDALMGCTGGTGKTVAGNAYLCPDPSLRFQAAASSTKYAVTIACPPGMTINGLGSALTLAAGHLYTAVLDITPTAANWAIC